jgi:hypothetical protein
VTRRAKPNKAGVKSGAAKPAAASRRDEATEAAGEADDAVSYSDLTLHQLFEQQAGSLLERADIDEEQRQAILLAMSCPCCAVGGMSFSMKLKRK